MNLALFHLGLWMVPAIGLIASGASWCQSYPAKPIRMIVSGPAAGGADVIGRPIAQRLSESLGQPVIVDNRPGAAGVIAFQATMAAPADGYTVLLAGAVGLVLTPLLAKKPLYDPVRDFVPVTLIATASLLAAVHPSLPVKSIKDLIGLAKARPKQLLYASNGNGTIQHLTTEMLSQASGISMLHVPYNGGTPAVLNTMSGQVQLVITAIPTVLHQVRAGRLRGLAVTGAKRAPAAHDLPTVAESGLPGFESTQWYAIVAPGKTPGAHTDKLYGEIRKAVETPGVNAALAHEGAEVSASGPAALAEFHAKEMAKWRRIVHQTKLSFE